MNKNAANGEVVYALVDAVFDAANTNGALIESLLSDLGLSSPQANAIWRLQPGEMRPMRELAQKLHCDPSTLTDIVDGLEDKGMTKRIASPTDRRVKLLQLTSRGEKTREALVMSVTTNTSISRLTASEQETLLDLLTKIR